MPYIENEKRLELNPIIETLAEKINTISTLNYALTNLCLKFLNRSVLSYTALNEIIGVLESAKLEFYRKTVADYENEKCDLNGEVYNI
jgi:hypothetical protein